ncbi:MAG: UPF0489 family protein [Ignavibacteriales bacterium]|nr:UPF0489 family protein [Ignavibacteriales bacterium]
MKILDIDLDFFLDKVAYNRNLFSEERLPSRYYKPWKIQNVITFMNNNCSLKGRKIQGKYFIHHHEVFHFLKNLCINSGKVEIDHIDAHADIGLGDTSYEYISNELLSYSVKKRLERIVCNGKGKNLTPGNYLAYAISCRWINKLNYIHPVNEGNDLAWFHFKDFTPSSNIIQMKHLSVRDINTVLTSDLCNAIQSIQPYSYEPEIPFQKISATDFNSDGNYNYVLLTKSPGFTPIESDKLIPVISKFMNL